MENRSRASALHHLAISGSDLGVSAAFYDAVLAIVGYTRTVTSERVCAWTGPDPEILLYRTLEENADDRHATGQAGWHHAAFLAGSRDDVDAVHRLLVDSDSTILDAPAEYPRYSDGYYAVYFEDPDGLKLEVAFIPAHHEQA